MTSRMLRIRSAPRVDAEAALLLDEVADEIEVCAAGRGMHQPLEADVLVRPQRPARAVVAVDLELVTQQLEPPRVLRPVLRVDGAELADPDGGSSTAHVLGTAQEGLLDDGPIEVLSPGDSGVGGRTRDPRQRVVVRRVHGVGHGLGPCIEEREVGRVAVAVEEEDVPVVHGADRLLEPLVERGQHLAARVARLVDRVEPGDLGPVLVAIRQRFPEIDHAVLEVGVVPELGDVRRVVAVPVLILPARQRMQVEDRIDAVATEEAHDAIEPGESLLFQHERSRVVLEVAVVERDADTVDSEGCEVGSIRFVEEVPVEGLEECVESVPAHAVQQQPANRALVAGVARDEVLHVHPAAQAHARQTDRRAFPVDEIGPSYGEEIQVVHVSPSTVKSVGARMPEVVPGPSVARNRFLENCTRGRYEDERSWETR